MIKYSGQSLMQVNEVCLRRQIFWNVYVTFQPVQEGPTIFILKGKFILEAVNDSWTVGDVIMPGSVQTN